MLSLMKSARLPVSADAAPPRKIYPETLMAGEG
jgi:hypothetical protein